MKEGILEKKIGEIAVASLSTAIPLNFVCMRPLRKKLHAGFLKDRKKVQFRV